MTTTIIAPPNQLDSADICPGCGAPHELQVGWNECQACLGTWNAVQAQPGPERLEVEMTYRIPDPVLCKNSCDRRSALTAFSRASVHYTRHDVRPAPRAPD